MFALAATVSEKIKFKIVDLEKVGQRHGAEKRHSIANVWMGTADFFHNCSLWQHIKTNEFHIFHTFENENVGLGHEGEKWDLYRSIEMFECVLLNFFIILAFQQHTKTNEFHIF